MKHRGEVVTRLSSQQATNSERLVVEQISDSYVDMQLDTDWMELFIWTEGTQSQDRKACSMTEFLWLQTPDVTLFLLNSCLVSCLTSCHRGLLGSPTEEKGSRVPAKRQDRRPLHQSRQSLRRSRRDLPQSARAAPAACWSHQVGPSVLPLPSVRMCAH